MKGFRAFGISMPMMLAFALQAVSAIAAPPPLAMRHVIDLRDFKGKPFLNAMTVRNGIKAKFDHDYEDDYTVASPEVIADALDNFDDKIHRKIGRAFGSDRDGLRKLVKQLQGRAFKPSNMLSVIGNRNGKYDIAQVVAMGSGAGTLVKVNADNYYYNYGYKSGADKKEDVKSGRSFGAGPEHNANDASDTFYLTELKNYLDQTPEPRAFYTAIMKVLTQTDPSGFGARGFSNLGQTVATDFLAIYTAESDRHIMVDLSPRNHPWENDLAECTFISAYGTAAGKVMIDGALVDGEPKQWWALNEETGRSGIGKTRRDRRQLQAHLSAFEREKHPELTQPIEAIIGGEGPSGDLYQGVMEYLNNYRTQASVERNAEALTSAFVEFLLQTRKDAEALTAYVLENQDQ